VSSYENYDLQEVDPYLIPGSTCLSNCLGITDTQALNAAEADISSASLAELIAHPVPATFDLHHLKCIHQRLFAGIYPWAGETRETEIGKGGHLFLPYHLITEKAANTFMVLHDEQLLAGLTKEEFGARAGYFLGRINAMHPFREGNGRTQRILLDQLAEQSGYIFEWTAISGEQMALACREARTGDDNSAKLSRLLMLNTLSLDEAGARL